MSTNKINSKELTLRNLASDITSEIKDQIKNQDILSIPLSNYRDENYIGSAGTESLYDIDSDVERIMQKSSKDGILSSLSWKMQDAKYNKGVCDNISLRVGESPVINPPWQFNELDDVRSNLTYPHMGRVYLTYIYSNFPILTIQPGREKMNANILSFFTKSLGTDHKVLNDYIRSGGDKNLLNGIKVGLTTIKNITLGAIEGALSLMGLNFSDASKFITFKPAMKLYRELTNNLLREFAANLGLLDISSEGALSNTGLNFDVEKGSGNLTDEQKEDFKKMKEAGVLDSDTEDSIYGNGGTVSNSNEYMASFGNTTTDSNFIHSVENAVGKEFTKMGSTYRGTFGHLDVLEMIPHVTFRNGNGLNSFFGDFENRSYLPFLCQSNISISETFSNSTKEHPIVGQINGMSESRESEKGFGGVGQLVSSVQNAMGGGGVNDILNDAFNVVKNKATGEAISNVSELGMLINGDGKMAIPEIWASSSYSRSYSVEFKFWSPVGDIVSIFENVYIPYLLLMVLASPLQTGYHSYVSPFVIRVFSKGLFSIDMGIIESLNITRGDGANDRTRANFPRSIKVSVSVKDLSPVMMLSLGNGTFWKYKRANSGLSEYIATMCNLSLSDRLSLARKFDTYWSIMTAGFRDKFSLTNIGYTIGNSFLFKPARAWNRNKVTVDSVKTNNIYM